MTLEAAVKRGASQLRDSGLQGMEAVVQRQKGMLAKGHNDGFFFRREGRGAGRRPHRRILHRSALAPFGHRLRIDVVAGGQCSQALLTMLDRPTHCRCRSGAPV